MSRKHEVWIQWRKPVSAGLPGAIRLWDGSGKLILDTTPASSWLAVALDVDVSADCLVKRIVSVELLGDALDATSNHVFDARGNICLLTIQKGKLELCRLLTGETQSLKFRPGSFGLDADIAATWHKQFQFVCSGLLGHTPPNRITNTINGVVRQGKKPGRKKASEPKQHS